MTLDKSTSVRKVGDKRLELCTPRAQSRAPCDRLRNPWERSHPTPTFQAPYHLPDIPQAPWPVSQSSGLPPALSRCLCTLPHTPSSEHIMNSFVSLSFWCGGFPSVPHYFTSANLIPSCKAILDMHISHCATPSKEPASTPGPGLSQSGERADWAKTCILCNQSQKRTPVLP